MITFAKSGWHFTLDKKGFWHIVRDGLIGAVCGGTPRQKQADHIAKQWMCWICPACADKAGHLLVGYRRTCMDCHETLDESMPYNYHRCQSCQMKQEQRVRRHGTPMGNGNRRSIGRGRFS